VRIAPNQYSINDPAAIKTIYGHGTQFIKAPWYRASGHPDVDKKNLFTEENPRLHSENRKKVASLYSLSSLVQYEPYVADSIQILLTRFEEMARSEEVVDVRHWLQCLAFDAIAQLTVRSTLLLNV
jgi:cytochrome P450